MIIVRTPFRMSLFGGGTDYKEYYEKYGGSVLSATINKYCYVTLRDMPPIFGYKNQLTYSKIERFDEAQTLSHPLVREAIKYMGVDRIQITYDADLPARSGIGSSSAFAVGLLQGLYAMRDEYPDKMTLANEAVHVERELCNEAGGVQDQYSVAIGGLNRLNFSESGIEVKPMMISGSRKKELRSSMMLMFTGFTHFSGKISESQRDNIKNRLSELDEMKKIVDEGEKLLCSASSPTEIGRLMSQAWKIKRSFSNDITNETMDSIYESAMKAGAVGGKLLGAGGGGFMLLFAEPDKHEYIKEKMSDFYFPDFDVESEGTTIIYHSK